MTNCIRLTASATSKWDEFVFNHPSATPYHMSHWLQSVEEAYGHKRDGFFLEDAHGQMTAVLPFCHFKKLSQKYVFCSLPFCDVGGSLTLCEENEETLILAMSHLGEQSGISTAELRLRGDEVTEQELESDAYLGKKISMIMALEGDAQTLLKSFKPKLRSQIKKAEKNGLTVKTCSDASLIDDFYTVISQNMKDLGSPVHSKNFYRRIMDNYKSNACTCIVYLDDKPCAAGIVLKTAHNACIPWASSLREYNRLAPNMLLYWTLLAHIADNGIRQFDFGRSTFNEGTYRFKKQWGAKPFALNWGTLADRLAHSAPTTVSPVRSIVETVWKKLPLSVTTTCGPIIRKHISL